MGCDIEFRGWINENKCHLIIAKFYIWKAYDEMRITFCREHRVYVQYQTKNM